MRQKRHANTGEDYQRARELRNATSPIEQKLWRKLRETAAAHGLKFRRQQAVHPYIADFACLKARLLIELDGATHDHTVAYDQAREKYLRTQGFSLLRFSNQQVAQDMDGVIEMIVTQAENLLRKQEEATPPAPPHP